MLLPLAPLFVSDCLLGAREAFGPVRSFADPICSGGALFLVGKSAMLMRRGAHRPEAARIDTCVVTDAGQWHNCGGEQTLDEH